MVAKDNAVLWDWCVVLLLEFFFGEKSNTHIFGEWNWFNFTQFVVNYIARTDVGLIITIKVYYSILRDQKCHCLR